MALVFFEVLLLGASMVRIHDHDRVIQYPRAIPFLLMLVAAAGTLYFNAIHVPDQVRPLALAVPAASILVTLGLAYLLKMLATASGAAAIHLAPPAPEPNRTVRHADVLHGELVRDSQVPDGAPPRTARCPHGRLRNSTKMASRRWPVTGRRPSATRSRPTWPPSTPASSDA